MKVLFLGTGTSTGIPQLNCDCWVCKSTNPKDKRLRASVQVQVGDTSIIIDCGPDFRQQALRYNLKKPDAFLLTHEHFDHVAGMDEVRPFRSVDVFAEDAVIRALHRNMPYIFCANPYPGAPKINLHTIDSLHRPFYVNDVEIIPIRIYHNQLPILGFRIQNFAYLTDFTSVPPEEMHKLEGLEVIVVDALRQFNHPAHMMLSEALDFVGKVKAKTSYFTHMSHDMGLHDEVQAKLPENVFFAWDGLGIQL